MNLNNIIFILGNGRSGTHMIADLIKSSGEEEPAFTLSCKINIYNQYELIPDLLNFYKNKNNYIDKCHPNLWIANLLKTNFPNAKFIIAVRQKPGNMESMLKHNGCMSWFNDKNIKFPNKFIGVQSESQLKKISKTELCELRYTSHINEITNLKNNNFRALYFEYENRFEHANLLEKYLNIKIDKTILR